MPSLFSLRKSSSASSNPFRRSPQPAEPPPPYTQNGPVIATGNNNDNSDKLPAATKVPADPSDPYAALSRFDTVFLIDDSGSMYGSNWTQTLRALEALIPICTDHDTNGVDIHFLNSPHRGTNITKPAQLLSLFERTRPSGSTPTGKRLEALLTAYIALYRRSRGEVKPLNIICITDGEPSDPRRLEHAIVNCARELDKLGADDRQVGVQFFQVGTDEGATEALEELDNALVEEWGVRDMVDTISWKAMNGGRGLSGEGVLKAVMGAVDGKLDRKRRFN